MRRRRFRSRRGRKRYRKRVSKRRTGRTVGKLNDNTSYRYVRWQNAGSLTPNSALPGVGGSLVFRLGDIPAYNEFVALYDQYRIRGVKVMFVPSLTENDVAGTNWGQFLYAPDYDDGLAPTNAVELLQKQSCKIRYSAGRPFSVFVRPESRSFSAKDPDSAPTFGTILPGIAVPKKTWLDCAWTSIPHFGLKWWWQNATANTIKMELFYKFYVEFKNVR